MICFSVKFLVWLFGWFDFVWFSVNSLVWWLCGCVLNIVYLGFLLLIVLEGKRPLKGFNCLIWLFENDYINNWPM